MEAQRSEVTYTRSHSNDSGKGPEFRCLDSLALTLAAVAHIHPKARRGSRGSTKVGPVPRGEKKDCLLVLPAGEGEDLSLKQPEWPSPSLGL